MLSVACTWSFFALLGCQTESVIEDQNDISNMDRKVVKVQVCHFSKTENTWDAISVSGNALSAYLQHGDVQLIDADGDGYVEQINECMPGGDCNDSNAEINPGEIEMCDGMDNNCDGNIDEGFDTDSDGFTTCQGDCDDEEPSINPGADEICGNGVDDNCNGQTDEECETDLIAYYRFNDDVMDEIGSHNGTPTSISYVAGKSGKAVDLSAGTSSRVNVTDAGALSFGDGSSDSAFSISFYVNWSTVTDSFLIDKRSSGSGDREYSIWFDEGATNFLVFRCFDQSTGGYIEFKHVWTASSSTWYHITATYSGSGMSSGMALYIDGAAVGSSSSSGNYTAMENGTGSLVLGKLANGNTFSLDGYLDGLGVWSKELTADEASFIYSTQNQGTEIL